MYEHKLAMSSYRSYELDRKFEKHTYIFIKMEYKKPFHN